jgi:hypothetical protein
MLAVRRLLLLALLGLIAAALAGPANAARPSGYPEMLRTQHFEVHYVGGPAVQSITHQQAGDLAAMAEKAYATIVTDWGYPAPLPDIDGRTDIWVEDHSALEILGYAEMDTPGTSSPGWFTLDVTAIGSQAVIAHELMHVIQFGIWVPADSWLLEGTAEWAGFNASGFTPFGGVQIASTVGAPDMSLNCVSDACGTQGDPYEVGGYSRWTFFQYLSERFGNTIVRDVLARGAALADPALTGAEILDSAVAQQGTTLSDVYGDYTFKHIAGNYEVAGLKGAPPAAHSTLSTGEESGALPIAQVAVNHLATRYLRFTRGGGAGPCYLATLSLAVGLPDGVTSTPSFYWKALGTAPIALAVNGNTATATIPWDTCTGGQDGYLALPNQSLTADAAVFTVGGSLSVDFNTVASRLAPPIPTYTGPNAAADGNVAPAIRVRGAQVIRVKASNRLVRLIVFSSGPGKLQAKLGNKILGTRALRPGNNDVRFYVPASAVKGLRSVAAVRAPKSLLTLTSFSVSGAKGKSATRRVTVVPVKRG